MEWLTRGWDQAHLVACCVGVAAGVSMVVLGASGLAELGSVLVSVLMRWAMWQIPPPGRARADGSPPDALSRLGQLAVAVLLIVLVLELVTVPIH
jgi:hypothetical protein